MFALKKGHCWNRKPYKKKSLFCQPWKKNVPLLWYKNSERAKIRRLIRFFEKSKL